MPLDSRGPARGLLNVKTISRLHIRNPDEPNPKRPVSEPLDGRIIEQTMSTRQIQVRTQVLRAISGKAMWLPGEKVVLAVSGGPDSLCLLHILHTTTAEHGGLLHVAHLDHRFRGERSAAEAERVATLARQWGLPASVEARDVPALARERKLSPEEAARQVRYRFLAEVAAREKAAVIALGHTADDQVETVLLHLLRGCGLAGLRGMRPLAPAAPWMVAGLSFPRPLRLARPLLGVTRAQTEAVCTAAGLEPSRDEWNRDPRFLRVRLRQEVLPLLEQINPGVREALLRLAQQAAWWEEDAQAMLAERWPALASQEKGGLRLDLQQWEQLPRSLRLPAIRRAVEQVRGHLEDLGWAAVLAAGDLVQATVGSEVSLVEEVIARRTYAALLIGRRTDLDRAAAALWPDLGPEPLPLNLPGCTTLPGGHRLEASLHPRSEAPLSASRWEACLDADRCGQPLWLRHRRPGDRIHLPGMRGSKTLQDLFVDEKVPRDQRARIPLVVSPQGIVWVVGYRSDGRFWLQPDTPTVLRLRWHWSKGEGYA